MRINRMMMRFQDPNIAHFMKVEAVERVKYQNVLGTQFHPEFSLFWETEAKHKFTPSDKDLFAANGLFKAHPPSLEFHKKLWAWFFDRVKKR